MEEKIKKNKKFNLIIKNFYEILKENTERINKNNENKIFKKQV